MSQPLGVTDLREPELSVLLVTHGAWEWTERCLGALFETTDAPFELICIDNASPDGSADRLALVPGIRLTRRSDNVGYGAAANLAAMTARAPRLLLLNTDAIVQPEWLPPLRWILDREDDVAAVAPRLLHVDGRLQEAGSIIWGDGQTDCYGDGDDPQLPAYAFRRDVDYASAACLLVRRTAFIDAGGFDPLYQPAYYEDTDLAMRWRSRGMRVVYQPLSSAVHKRWASSGTRGAAESLVERHRPLFVDRWQAWVTQRPRRPPSPSRAALVAIRDSECGERVLALIGHFDAHPSEVTVQVLREFGQSHAYWRRTLICSQDEVDHPVAAALRSQGVEVVGLDGIQAWLAERKHHYTFVLGHDDLDVGVVRALCDHQPFAARALVANSSRGFGDRAGGWAQASAFAICAAGAAVARLVDSGVGLQCVRLDQPAARDRIAQLAYLRTEQVAFR